MGICVFLLWSARAPTQMWEDIVYTSPHPWPNPGFSSQWGHMATGMTADNEVNLGTHQQGDN